MHPRSNYGRKSRLALLSFLWAVSLLAQQGWENSSKQSADYFFAAQAFAPAAQYFHAVPHYPSLADDHTAAHFYTIATALRLNISGSEKMLGAFITDHPTSYLSETAYFDAANFYFNRGKYSYALKWYRRINESEVARYSRPLYNFNKGYTYFVTRQYKNAKPLFEKVKALHAFESDANYYLGYISYQLDDFEEANKNFEKLNRNEDDNTIGYFQADMNFKLGRFDKAIALAEKALKNADPQERSELSKIIGESYFNLEKYPEALPYLMGYKGKRGRWKNTDFYQLGYTHYRVGDWTNAIAQFNKIISGKNALAQNAYYHLAECYLKTDQKTAALNAFKSAANMSFDAVIKEDAALNYAKLSYDVGNAFESTSVLLQNFIKTYPKNEANPQLEELLLDSYVRSNNYDGALALLKKVSGKKYAPIRQRVHYKKAISLYKGGQFAQAVAQWDEALKVDDNPPFETQILYWKSQALYALAAYEDSIETLQTVLQSPFYKRLDYAYLIPYHVGYAFFKLKNYPQALNQFEAFLNQSDVPLNYQRDALLRLGDSHFVLKAYWPAMDQYEKAIRLAPQSALYAMYQQAISYGFVDRLEKKIALLGELLTQFPSSRYVDDALFELALSHTQTGDYAQAISYYNQLIGTHLKSPYRSRALLNKGLIYYNQEQSAEALTVLKNLVDSYPNEALAQQAFLTIKEIAIDQNQVDDFAQWAKGTSITSISDLELEKAAYQAIERLLEEQKKKAAQKALTVYLENYPQGTNALVAAFQLAELYFEEEEWESALQYYNLVADQDSNEYTEQTLVRMTQAYLKRDEQNKAVVLWELLVASAQFEENKRYAQFNLMQFYFKEQDYAKAVNYAETILGLNALDEQIKWDALYILAKAAEMQKNLPKAAIAYAQLEKAPQAERAVEALFFNAQEKHKDKAYAASNVVIEKIAQNYAGFPEWNAKSLLLMAQNFYALEDAFQASFILESLIENFAQFPEIKAQATEELEKIKALEAKENASINSDNNANE